MFKQISNWLEVTPFSQSLQTIEWAIPLIQTVHILALSIVLASVLMIDLRLLNIAWRRQPIVVLAERFLPPAWNGVLVLLASGALLIIAEPGRTLMNPVFYFKMITLVCVLLITLFFRSRLRRNAAAWDQLPPNPGARVFAVASILMWVAITFAGRFIAYTDSLT
jgi:hypothetical protein